MQSGTCTVCMHPFAMETAAILVHSLNRFSLCTKMAAVVVAKLLLCCDIICKCSIREGCGVMCVTGRLASVIVRDIDVEMGVLRGAISPPPPPPPPSTLVVKHMCAFIAPATRNWVLNKE